jgi:sulfate adenylyltransferase
LVRRYADELEIEMIPFEEMMYVPERGEYVPQNEVRPSETPMRISGTELRRRLRAGIDIPAWLSFPEVLDELRTSSPPRHRQGLVVFFTGLPSSGKSTIANALLAKLNEDGTRPVTILDGDVVQRHLSSELGFSREHRDLNVLRIGYVASLIAKSGGIAICAPIAPYENIRRQVRELVEAIGGFIEAHVATPVETCEKRDRKGLSAGSRRLAEQLHRHQRSLRGADRSRPAHRHRRIHARPIGSPDLGENRGIRIYPLNPVRPRLGKQCTRAFWMSKARITVFSWIFASP